MKRSRVNDILAEGAAFFAKHGWSLPPFADWSAERLQGPEGANIRDRKLGWDITDYGQGRFDEMGLFLFTMRNGDMTEMGTYAESLLTPDERILRRERQHPIALILDSWMAIILWGVTIVLILARIFVPDEFLGRNVFGDDTWFGSLGMAATLITLLLVPALTLIREDVLGLGERASRALAEERAREAAAGAP